MPHTPLPGVGLSSPPITTHFSAKRPRPLPLGTGLKLRCVQRAGAITDVTGDTEQCKEMLLKPLGFRWERSLKIWRWDGQGDDSHDPTTELLARAARDGVEVTHVKFRAATTQHSARAMLASLMADVDSPAATAPAAVAPPPGGGVALPAVSPLAMAPTLAAAAAPATAGVCTTTSYFDDDCLPDEAFLSLPDGPMPLPRPPLPPPPPSMLTGPAPYRAPAGTSATSTSVPWTPVPSAAVPARAMPAAAVLPTSRCPLMASAATMASEGAAPAARMASGVAAAVAAVPECASQGSLADPLADKDDWLLPDEVLASLPDVSPSAAVVPAARPAAMASGGHGMAPATAPKSTIMVAPEGAAAPAVEDDWQLPDDVLASLPEPSSSAGSCRGGVPGGSHGGGCGGGSCVGGGCGRGCGGGGSASSLASSQAGSQLGPSQLGPSQLAPSQLGPSQPSDGLAGQASLASPSSVSSSRHALGSQSCASSASSCPPNSGARADSQATRSFVDDDELEQTES